MNKRKVILRADGGPIIGMGHYTRTLALGEMLKDDFYCIYATRKPNEDQKKEILAVCDELIELTEKEYHFEEFLKIIKGDEIIVLDNYYFTTEYQRQIKQKGCKLVCIDDMQDKHYVADVVINHAEGINKSKFSKEEYTEIYTGLKYVLLRDYFLRQKCNYTKEIDLLISIGGSDPLDIISKIVVVISKLNKKLKIAVLLGSAYTGKLDQGNNKDIKIYQNIRAKHVADLMGISSVGLFPSSSISIEAIAIRMPFMTGYFADNQKGFYDFLIAHKIAKPMGNLTDIDFDLFTNNYNQLNNNYLFYKNKYKKLIDSLSPQRILEIFKAL